jgi:hypothetical protein
MNTNLTPVQIAARNHYASVSGALDLDRIEAVFTDGSIIGTALTKSMEHAFDGPFGTVESCGCLAERGYIQALNEVMDLTFLTVGLSDAEKTGFNLAMEAFKGTVSARIAEVEGPSEVEGGLVAENPVTDLIAEVLAGLMTAARSREQAAR